MSAKPLGRPGRRGLAGSPLPSPLSALLSCCPCPALPPPTEPLLLLHLPALCLGFALHPERQACCFSQGPCFSERPYSLTLQVQVGGTQQAFHCFESSTVSSTRAFLECPLHSPRGLSQLRSTSCSACPERLRLTLGTRHSPLTLTTSLALSLRKGPAFDPLPARPPLDLICP